jgi:hypothetical protein
MKKSVLFAAAMPVAMTANAGLLTQSAQTSESASQQAAELVSNGVSGSIALSGTLAGKLMDLTSTAATKTSEAAESAATKTSEAAESVATKTSEVAQSAAAKTSEAGVKAFKFSGVIVGDLAGRVVEVSQKSVKVATKAGNFTLTLAGKASDAAVGSLKAIMHAGKDVSVQLWADSKTVAGSVAGGVSEAATKSSEVVVSIADGSVQGSKVVVIHTKKALKELASAIRN